MVDLSPYFQKRLMNKVYAASLAAEEREAGARPPHTLDPELLRAEYCTVHDSRPDQRWE